MKQSTMSSQQLRNVCVSVPGKILLMGDHAVVHGKPALLTAVNMRMYIKVRKQNKKEQEKNKPVIVKSEENGAYVIHAVKVAMRKLMIDKLPPICITISSQIPAGYHLGTSAAVAVGTTGAIMYGVKKIWNPELMNTIAYEIEKKMHGNPSGVDNTAVTFGGFAWYRKELEFLKSIWQLPFRFPKELKHFFLIDTGTPKENTGEMVALVQKRLDMSGHKIEQLFHENEVQTKRIAIALKEKDENTLIDGIQKGERTLERMGVVSKKVMPCVREIEKSGGACKILGGGGVTSGVGYMLGYHKDIEQMKKLCAKYSFSIQSITLGEEGVRLESGR